MWSEPSRAHPAGIVEYALRYLRASVAPLFGIVATSVAVGDARAADFGWLPMVVLGLLLGALVAVGAAVVRWLSFTFWIEDGTFRVEQGLVVRKSTRIAPKRIQSVDTRANLIFRVLGLTTVEIHTAGRGGGPEVSIPALTEADARELASELKRSGEAPRDDVPDAEAPLTQPAPLTTWALTGRELAIMAFTSSGGLLAIAAVASSVPLLLEDVLGFEALSGLGVVAFAAVVSVLFVGAWLIGSAATALQYWEFSVKRTESEVLVERGLFERSTRTVPLRRVQAVRLKEGLLRQLLGRVTIAIDVAGIAVSGEAAQSTDSTGPTVLHPLVRTADATGFTDVMLPGHPVPELVPLPRAALSRYVFRAVAVPGLIAAALVFLVPFGWLGLVLPVVSGVWGVWAYRDARWGLGADVLALRWRDIGRTTAFVRRQRIQSVAVSQHPLQRAAGLASLSVRVAASPANATFELLHLPEVDAMRILAWVAERSPGVSPPIAEEEAESLVVEEGTANASANGDQNLWRTTIP